MQTNFSELTLSKGLTHNFDSSDLFSSCWRPCK